MWFVTFVCLTASISQCDGILRWNADELSIELSRKLSKDSSKELLQAFFRFFLFSSAPKWSKLSSWLQKRIKTFMGPIKCWLAIKQLVFIILLDSFKSFSISFLLKLNFCILLKFLGFRVADRFWTIPSIWLGATQNLPFIQRRTGQLWPFCPLWTKTVPFVNRHVLLIKGL